MQKMWDYYRMKNSRSKKIATILAIAGVSAVFFVFPTISQAQVEEKTFVTMEGAVITT